MTTQTAAIAERPQKSAERITLDDLFTEALSYGRPMIKTNDKRQFWATIEFETVAGINLTARRSGYTATPHEALRQAIAKAMEIRSAFK
jgi:hypothetical protein